METLLEAIHRLRGSGYPLDLLSVSEGRLRCATCGELVDARDVVVDETVRFEGESNPDDEAILVALTTPCGHRGLFSAAYGPATAPDDVEVLQALSG